MLRITILLVLSAVLCDAVVKNVAVVGGGIGGLSVTHALRYLETGVTNVDVFERQPKIAPNIGGGLQLNGGAVVLTKLGLGDEIKNSAEQVKRIWTRSVSGRTLLDLDIVKATKKIKYVKDLVDNGTPMFFTIMRDRLQEILLNQIPKDNLKLNKRVVAIKRTEEGVVLGFKDGTSAGPYDMVIGAGGIRGAVQEALVDSGSAIPPVYSGIRIQFGVGPAGSRPKEAANEMHQWFGGNTYALTATYGGLSNQKWDMIAVVYGDRKATKENEEWNESDAKDECIDRLESKSFPGEVTRVAAGSERFFELGVHYRNPFGQWKNNDGSVVLLGDSAHAMPPTLGQGANQAIQDAYCLASNIKKLNAGEYTTLAQAVEAYEKTRKFPVASLLAKSVFLGAVETLDGDLGSCFRDNFFATMGALGVAESVLMQGAIPKI